MAPFGALAMLVVLILSGRIWFALALAAAGFAVFQATLVSPSFARWLETTLARVAHTIGHGVGLVLSWALLGVVFLAVIVPVWLLTLPFRRPFGRPRSPAWDGWASREGMGRSGAPTRSYGAEPGRSPHPPTTRPAPPDRTPTSGSTAGEPGRGTPSPPRRPRRRHVPTLAAAVAVVAGLVVLDLLAGALLTTSGILPGERGDIRRAKSEAISTTMAAPAMRSAPWADEFGDELLDFQLAQPRYVPFLVTGQHPFHGRYLNTTDRERVSYQPPASGDEPLRVAFFGGSTVFGIGQRDAHTIPSEFARAAEEDGVAVEVHNYGFPARVSWQEFQDFERLLADGERYDLVVFYDGFNEFLVQQSEYSEDPTHVGAGTFQEFASDFNDVHEAEPGLLDGLHDVAAAYRSSSATARIVDHLLGTTPEPSWVPTPSAATPAEQTDTALDIYRRSVAMITDLADDHDTPVRFVWQPTAAGWDASVTDRLPDGVIDLSGTFDGRQSELYIDEVHTNEEGARLMGQTLWDELGPELEAGAADR